MSEEIEKLDKNVSDKKPYSTDFYPIAIAIVVSVLLSLIGAKMILGSSNHSDAVLQIKILDPLEIRLSQHGIESYGDLQPVLDLMGEEYAKMGYVLFKAGDIVNAPEHMYVTNREFGRFVKNHKPVLAAGNENGKTD